MGVDVYVIPSLDIEMMRKNDENIGYDESTNTLYLKENPESRMGTYGEEQICGYFRVWKNSGEILEYVEKKYGSSIVDDGYAEEIFHLEQTGIFEKLPLGFETYKVLFTAPKNSFWSTLMLYFWLNDKKVLMDKCQEAKEISDWDYGHLKSWEKHITSDEQLKPMAEELFGEFFKKVDDGEIVKLPPEPVVNQMNIEINEDNLPF